MNTQPPIEQLSFILEPVLERTGPDSFRVKSWKQAGKLTVKKCAERAQCSEDSIRRMIEAGIIKAERPTPRRTLVDPESFETYLRERKDPEFWDGHRRQSLADLRKPA